MRDIRSVIRTLITVILVILLTLSGTATPVMGTALVTSIDDPTPTPVTTQTETPPPTVVIENETVGMASQTIVNLTLTKVPEGLAGYILTFEIGNDNIANISKISYGDKFTQSFTNTTRVGQSNTTIQLKAQDFGDITPGQTDIQLASIKINGSKPGSTPLSVRPIQFDNENGSAIEPATSTGELVVSDSEELPSATLEINNQTLSDRTAQPIVSRAALGNQTQYVIVAHKPTSTGEIGPKIGESQVLAGQVESVSINIRKTVGDADEINSFSATQTVVTMLHRANTTDNDDINHGAPVIRNGSTVTDRAHINVSQLETTNATVESGNTETVPVRLSSAPQGLSGYNITVNVLNESVGRIVNATYSEKLNLTEQPLIRNQGNAVRLRATDLGTNISATGEPVQLARIAVSGERLGSTQLTPVANKIDDEDGFAIKPISSPGSINVIGDNRTVVIQRPRDIVRNESFDIRVVDQDGEPIENATVIVESDENRTQTTNKAGNVTLTARDGDGSAFFINVTGEGLSTVRGFNTTVFGSGGEGRLLEPANVTITNIELEEERVVSDENATVSVTLRNTGEVASNETLVVSSNTRNLASRTIEIGGNKTRIVEIATPLTTANRGDTRSLSVNETDAGTVEVQPAVAVTEFEVSPRQVEIGEGVAIQATVLNRRSRAETANISILINGNQTETATISIPAPAAGSESSSVTETIRTLNFDEIGGQTISLGGAGGSLLDNQTVTVNKQSVPLNLEVSTTNPAVNETVRFSVTRADTGTPASATVSASGESVQTGSNGLANLSFDESGEVTATISKTSTTDTEFENTTQTLTVSTPANITVEDAELTTDEVVTNEAAQVVVTLTNTGQTAGTRQIEISTVNRRRGGFSALTTRNVTLSPGSTTTILPTVVFETVGDRNVSVEANDIGTLTVDPSIIATDGRPVSTPIANNSSVDVTVNLENRGPAADTRIFNISLGGQTNITEFTLPSNSIDSRTVSFDEPFTSDAVLRINGSAENLTELTVVDAVADYQLRANGSLGSTSTVEGAPVEFNLTVDNENASTENIPVVVSNESGQVNEFDINVGESTTQTFDEPGVLTVETDAPRGSLANATDISQGSVRVDVQQRATIAITDASVQSEAVTNESVPVTLSVTNSGDRSGSASLSVFNTTTGVSLNTTSVTVNASESKDVDLDVSFDSPGTRTLGAGRASSNVTTGELDIEPAVVIDDVSVSSRFVSVSEDFDVNVTLANQASTNRSNVPVNLSVGGEQRSGTITPDATPTLSFTQNLSTSGTQDVTVAIPRFDTVEDAGAVSVSRRSLGLSLSVNKTQITNGSSVTFTTTAAGSPVEATVSVADKELTTDSDGTVSTVINETDTFTARATKGSNETTQFRSDTTALTVVEPATFEILSTTIENDEELIATEPVNVTATVLNTGGARGNVTLNITAAQNASATGTVRPNSTTPAEIGAGNARDVELNVTFDEPATQFLRVNGTEIAAEEIDEITIERPIIITRTTVTPRAVTATNETSQTLFVNATLENRATTEQARNIDVSIENTSISDVNVSVQAGKTVTQNLFTRSFNNTDREEDPNRGVTIAGEDAGQITLATDTQQLDLTANETTLAAGEPIQFNATENGTAESATVEVAGQTLTTGPNGTVATTIPVADNYVARVSKAQTGGVDFAGDTLDITVTDPITIENTANFAFGNVSADPDGETTQAANVTINNSGGRGVNVGGVAIRGADADGFAVVDAPSSVAANSDANITIEFTPTRRDKFDAELRFRTDTPQQPRRTVEITGNGTAPDVRLSTQSVAFSDTDLDGQDTGTVTITNDGTEAVQLDFPANRSDTPFSTNRSDETLSIAPGSEIGLQAQFRPQEPDVFGEQLTIETNSSFTPTVSLSLSGTGLGAAIDVDQSFDFGELATGERANGRILITNDGTESVTLDPTVESNSTGFVVESAQFDSGISLDPGESRFLSVSATQTQITSDEEATATIRLENGGVTRNVSLTAEILEPDAEIVSPDTEPISFGSVAIGSTQSRGVTIENTGEAPLQIAQQNTFPVGSSFRLFGQVRTLVLNPQVVIRPGETATVPVFFTPARQGGATGTARLITNDPSFGTNGIREINTSGQGIRSELTASQSSVTFGEQGNRSQTTQTIELRNQGNAELSNLNLTLRGSDPAQFDAELQSQSQNIAGGGETTLELTYEPSRIASHTAQVELVGESPSGRRVTSSVSVSGTATPPDVNDLPGRVQFGFVPEAGVGETTTTETVAVENIGADSTRLDVASVTVTDTDNFSISDSPSPSVTGGNTTSIGIRFDPQQPGPITTTLRVITEDEQTQTQNVTLTGTGAAPAVELNQTSIDFGSQPTNQSSDERVIGVTNNGSAALTVNGASLDSDSGEFTAEVTPQTVVPGGTIPVTVTTTPGSPGIRNDTLEVNAENIPNPTIELQARGIQPELVVVSEFANGSNFGGTRLGSSTVQRLTLSNIGDETLELSNLRTTNDAFSIVGSQTSINLTTGESTTIGVSFAPEEERQTTATIQIDTNDPNTGTFTQEVSGTGLAPPDVSLNQTTTEFGTLAVESAEAQTLAITNDGDVQANITSVQITGADTTAFDVRGLGTISLAGGASESFTVEAAPTVTGSATATLEITTEENETLTATLGVTGTEPDIELSTQTLTFDRTRVGTTATEELQITNTGNAALNISAIQLVNVNAPSGQFFIDDEVARTVPAKGTETLTVAYAPSVTDVDAAKNSTPRNASIRVDSDDPDDPSLTVDVEATSKTAELDVQRSLSFGSLRIGSQTSRTLTIRNDVSATASLNLTETSIVGPDSDVFDATDPNVVGPDTTSKTELAPGEAAEVTIRLRPEQTGTQTATFILQTDDPRQPGRAVFLSNTQTIGFSILGSATFRFENIQPDRLPVVLPSVGAPLEDDNTARITQSTPAVRTTQPFNLTYEGASTPFNDDDEELQGVDAIRFIDIQTVNLSDNTFVNNTVEFSVAQTTLQTLPGSPDDVELYQYNGTGYESIPTSEPTVGSHDVRYTATYTELDRDLMVAINETNISLGTPTSPSAGGVVANGTSVDVRVDVTNNGNVNGSITLNLTRNGTVEQTRSVSVPAEQTQTETFSLELTQLGPQQLSINGRSVAAGSVTVGIPNLTLQDLTIPGPTVVTAGDTVELNGTIKNAGTADGTVTVKLTRNGTPVNSTEVSVQPDETETVSLSTRLSNTGAQQLNLTAGDEEVSREVIVEGAGAEYPPTETGGDGTQILNPTNISLADTNNANITQVQPAINATDNVSIALTFNGSTEPFDQSVNQSGLEPIRYIDITGTENLTDTTFINNSIEFVVSNSTIGSISDANKSDIELYQYNSTLGSYQGVSTSEPSQNGSQFQFTATYTRLDEDLVVAAERPVINISSASINRTNITQGDVVVVNATLENGGQAPGQTQVDFVRNGSRVNTSGVQKIEPSETQTIEFTTTLNNVTTIQFNVSLNSTDETELAGSVEVQEPVDDPGDETGTDNDGFGVLTALIAFVIITLGLRRIDEE